MLNTLNKDLQSAYATCESLQITYIDLPDVYEAAIVATQVAVQQATTKLYAQQAALIRKEIDVLRASAQQNITITNATAEAAAYSILQKAQVLCHLTLMYLSAVLCRQLLQITQSALKIALMNISQRYYILLSNAITLSS